MIARRNIVVSLVATGVVAAVSAQNPPAPPPPPPVDYTGLSKEQKAIVQGFAKLPEKKPSMPTKVFYPTGKPDDRKPGERYLDPGHPGAVSRPSPADYIRYIKVENDDLLPAVQPPDGIELRLITWKDGGPTSDRNRALVGIDNGGLLHIRIFEGDAPPNYFETKDGGVLHLKTADAYGKVTKDELESNFTEIRKIAIKTLKEQLPGLLPRQQELTDGEKGRVFRKVTTIIGKTPTGKTPADQVDCKPEYLPRIGSPERLTVTYDITPEGIYPKKDPFAQPPGTNLLPTVYQDARDGNDNVMINTLPSTPSDPYHLHADRPRVTPIDPASPTDDLGLIIERVYQIFTGTTLRGISQGLEDLSPKKRMMYLTEHATRIKQNAEFLRFHLKSAIDIIEGNPIQGRAYSGFPLLHHSGQNRIKRVMPVFGTNGDVVGGEVEVNQVWYDQRIESDTMFFDFKGWYDPPGSTLQPIPTCAPWTITYKVNVLNRGSDDFSTTTMFFDAPSAAKKFLAQVNPPASGPSGATHQGQDPASGLLCNTDPAPPGAGKLIPKAAPPSQLPHVSMDQTFFPMDAGTRTIVKIKMPPVKYYNLTYTWGWRIHPPRAQAIENAHKSVAVVGDCATEPKKYLVDFEMDVFGYLIRLVSWGDGSRVPQTGPTKLVVVGIDDNRRLHIRSFDTDGTPRDKDETQLTSAEARREIAALKRRIPVLVPPHVLTNAEGNQLQKDLASILGPDGQIYLGTTRFKHPIDAISDLAPAKRMWRSFRGALAVVDEVLRAADGTAAKAKGDDVESLDKCLCRIEEARDAYLDWKDRTHLPSGLRPDPRSDLTLFYANNTIYGEMYDGAFVDLAKWRKRPADFRVTLVNGDYFDHGYLNVDFGGNRGWENQFKSSIPVAGIGSFFTFGRFHWGMNTINGAITVPEAKGFKGGQPINPGELPDVVVPGVHRVWIQFNHDPGRRLRFYQFDPEHHDVNIYSIH
jgi:hypothetical protein